MKLWYCEHLLYYSPSLPSPSAPPPPPQPLASAALCKCTKYCISHTSSDLTSILQLT